ncbi:MAG: extracellular solute-binding protein [Thermaerobacter sp.]|jgi:iron(III) transport system substrate-binding protein|nr:extracellular solute-binding protein [Thermaerobacter sp.]
MPYRKTLVVAVAATVVLAGAGCGIRSAAAPAKQQLVFYSAQGYDKAEAAAFQKATGIQVKLDDTSTGPLIAKVEAERSNPRWDVIWFDGNGPIYALDQQHLLLQHWLPAAAKNYTSLGRSLLPPGDGYYPTGVTAAAAIAYNTKLVPASQAPATWHDLLKPFFRGAVAMNNPAISGPTYPFVAGILHRMGAKKGDAFFQDLKANGLKIYPTNGHTLKALVTGAVKVAMFQDSAETKAMVTGDPVRIVYPPAGVTMLPSDMAINAHAPDLAAAKQFVQFVLSPAGQRIMLTEGGGDSYFNPLIKGEKPNPARPQQGITWQNVPVAWQAAKMNGIQKWFLDHITR